MTKEQEKLLSLFEEINDICVRHDIVYYLAGGTLIGAMRHEGFIPWDDDMDILMTRDNWHKFLEVTKTDIPENRVVEAQETNREYPNMIGRYTDITSSAIHKNQILGDGVAGYIVDILILDPIPNKGEAYQQYIEDLMLYSDLINPSLNYSYRYHVNKDRFGVYYKRMKKEGKEKILRELEARMFSYKEDECDYYVMRWGGAPFIFDKDMYGSSRWTDFEGIKSRIPDRTGDYLTWHYGDDWMYIPPHDEQESHDAIFSFTTDYKTIQNDYMRYIDVPRVRKCIIKRKKFFLRNMEKRQGNKDEKARILAYGIKVNLENKISNSKKDIFECFKNEEYNYVRRFFADFYKGQFDRKIIGREDYLGIYRFNHPYYSEIDDDVLYIAVMVLIHTNSLAKAERLLNIREKAKGQLTKELTSARELIAQIREPISDYDLMRRDDSMRKTEALYEKYPKNMSVNMLYIRLLLEAGRLEDAKKVNDMAMAEHPKDGVYMKYAGDIIYPDDKEKAYELYRQALEHTTNGYTILEIEKIFKKDNQVEVNE